VIWIVVGFFVLFAVGFVAKPKRLTLGLGSKPDDPKR
jgi:hypothetical protein